MPLTSLVYYSRVYFCVEALDSLTGCSTPRSLSFTDSSVREIDHLPDIKGKSRHLSTPNFRAWSYTNPNFPVMNAGMALNSKRPEVSSTKKSSPRLVSV